MSIEQLEQSALNLAPEDRRRFFNWLYARETELVGGANPKIDAAGKRETSRRTT